MKRNWYAFRGKTKRAFCTEERARRWITCINTIEKLQEQVAQLITVSCEAIKEKHAALENAAAASKRCDDMAGKVSKFKVLAMTEKELERVRGEWWKSDQALRTAKDEIDRLRRSTNTMYSELCELKKRVQP